MVRFKHRYFTVEVEFAQQNSNQQGPNLNSYELAKSILNCVEELHGDFGVAAVTSGFKVKYCNPVTCLTVIRVRHGPHRFVASSLPIVKQVHKKAATIHILYTGATLKQCFRFAVKYQKQALLKMWRSLPSNNAQMSMERRLMDLSPFSEFDSSMRIPPEFSGGDNSTTPGQIFAAD